MPTTLTQAEFEMHVTAETVRRFFTDDGSGEPDEETIMYFLRRADAEAVGILMKGGTEEWARKLLASDEAVRGYAYDIAAGMMGVRRQEFLGAVQGNGGSLWSPQRAAAEKELERRGAAQVRAKGEAEAGENAHVALTVKPSTAPRVFRYADGRPKGGF